MKSYIQGLITALKEPYKYRAMLFLSELYIGVAYICFVFAPIWFLVTMFYYILFGYTAIEEIIYPPLQFLICGLILLSASECIKLFLDIEEHLSDISVNTKNS